MLNVFDYLGKIYYICFALKIQSLSNLVIVKPHFHLITTKNKSRNTDVLYSKLLYKEKKTKMKLKIL